jgi:hypothetical protein
VAGRLVHRDLCFGCGPINPFGLQLEAQQDGAHSIVGRFFVKQGLQGPGGDDAHPGVLAAALLEGVALAGGNPRTAQLDVATGAPVGTFVRVEATPDGAVARDDQTGEEVARVTCPTT